MHILLVADGRAPSTAAWIKALLAMQHRISLVSTYPCASFDGLEGQFLLPVAFASMGGSTAGQRVGTGQSPSLARRMVRGARSVFQYGRYWLGPLTLGLYAGKLRKIIQQAAPDLVHAFRIPFEGMLATAAKPAMPLAVTVWGNELTLHGYRSPLMRDWTVRTLHRANGLLADAHRDLRLAQAWGYAPEKPMLVLPGGGGIDLAEINRIRSEAHHLLEQDLPAGVPLVVNPRGIRPGYVRNDVFFEAIPLVLRRQPQAVFICPAMEGQAQAVKWVEQFKISSAVRLLPHLSQSQLWDLFHLSDVTVSLSVHDGTPNTLLEAMACGCFPIVGDLESLREWITPGVNGLVVEADKPQALAEALLLALDRPALRQSAAEINLDLIRQRAEISYVRAQAQVFYERVVNA